MRGYKCFTRSHIVLIYARNFGSKRKSWQEKDSAPREKKYY